jgi:transcriptional regulator with XRE-family HTH domain
MFNGDNLRSLRQSQGLTRAGVSQRSGISTSTLARFESTMSVPSIETLIKLSNCMGLPFEKLLRTTGILHSRK